MSYFIHALFFNSLPHLYSLKHKLHTHLYSKLRLSHFHIPTYTITITHLYTNFTTSICTFWPPTLQTHIHPLIHQLYQHHLHISAISFTYTLTFTHFHTPLHPLTHYTIHPHLHKHLHLLPHLYMNPHLFTSLPASSPNLT